MPTMRAVQPKTFAVTNQSIAACRIYSAEHPVWRIFQMLVTEAGVRITELGTTMTEETISNAVELATELTIAWLGNQNNRAAAEEVPAFLRTMHATVTELVAAGSPSVAAGVENTATEQFTPAVTARKSLASKDHIVSMIDGKPYKTLRRHLSTNGLTPEQYRERYNLKADYPMVAESYSEVRRAMAHRIGLGQKGRQAKAVASTSAPKQKRAARVAEPA